jgi:hypothetical protein
MKTKNDLRNTIYLVSVDTRGLPAPDLQEGFGEMACSREYRGLTRHAMI